MRLRSSRLALLVLALLVALVGFVPSAGAAKPHARTGIAMNHATIKLGKTVKIKGKVFPGQRGQRVALQQRSGSGWQTVKRATLSKTSHYSFSVRPKSTGLKRFRVFDPATKKSATSVSRVVKLRVKAKSSGGGGGNGGGSSSSCTPGYSPCVPVASDVDCAGGSGNGPVYVQGPITVTGSDPYGLDADGDGIACDF